MTEVDGEHAELRDGISLLRGDFREAFATLQGAISTLAATKTGEVAVLTKEMATVKQEHTATLKTVEALHRRLDEYPDPSSLQKTLDQFTGKLDSLATHNDMRQLENDLRAYPKPEVVQETVQLAQANRIGLVRMSALLLGSGTIGGVIASAVSSAPIP